MAVLWNDGLTSTASAIGPAVLSAPLKGVKTKYVLRQDFMCLITGYTPPDLNTAHPTYSDYVFVEEGEMDDAGGGDVCKFTRTYAKVPEQYVQFGNYGYHYIGFQMDSIIVPVAGFNWALIWVNGRERFTENVRAKFVYDYFLIGVGGAYSNENQIPQINATYYRQGDTFGSTQNQYAYVDYLIREGYKGYQPTVPTRETYETWVTADAADITSFTIVAETSKLTRWMGNIWQRETRYVKAI